MAIDRQDAVGDQTSTVGTIDFVIDGVALLGCVSFASALINGATYNYRCQNAANTEWEVGQGVWTAGTSTLTRVTIFRSSNGGAKTNFSAGIKSIGTVAVASDLGGGGGTPGGLDKQVQFDDGGVFGGNAALTFDKATGNFLGGTKFALSGHANAFSWNYMEGVTNGWIVHAYAETLMHFNGQLHALAFQSIAGLKWSGTLDASSQLYDTGIDRNAAGVVEVNNGTVGTFRDLKARTLLPVGGIVASSAPVIDATQTWNNSLITFTGFKLNITNTASATDSMLIDMQAGGVSKFSVLPTASGNGNMAWAKFGTNYYFGSDGICAYIGTSTGAAPNYLVSFTSAGSIWSTSGAVIGFASSAINSSNGVDTAIARNAAGVIEVNNGTAGAFRDLTLRTLLPVGGTVTADAPTINATQTWNNAAITFTGWKLNVTNTASAAASKLMDLQVAGTSVFSVDRAGNMIAGTANSTSLTLVNSKMSTNFNGDFVFGDLSNKDFLLDHNNNKFTSKSNGMYAWTSNSTDVTAAAADTALGRNAAGVIEINNGTAGAFRDLKARAVNTTGTVTGHSGSATVPGIALDDSSGMGLSYYVGVGGMGFTDQTFTRAWVSGVNGQFGVHSGGKYLFGSGTSPANNFDAGISRNAAGVVQVEDGSGALRDLKLRNLTASGTTTPGSFTVATLPSASTAGVGALAIATDLNSLTNGSTATAGGTSKGLVKSDGTNWIVLG